mgnify:CR=1 FL=1
MKYIIRTLLLACCCMQAQAQAPWKPDTELEKQLQQSNHVHRIMKANPAHAGLTRWEKKEVLKSRVLPLAEDFGALRHTGPGTIHVDRKVTVSGKGSVRLDTPAPWARRIQQTGITPPRRLSVPSTGKTCGNTTAFPFGYMWMHRAFI